VRLLGLALVLALAGGATGIAGAQEIERAWDLQERPYDQKNLAQKAGSNVRDGVVGIVNSFGQGLFSAARILAPFGGALGQKVVTVVGDVVGVVDNNVVTQHVTNAILSRHLLRYGAGAKGMPGTVGMLHDTDFKTPTPGLSDFVGPAMFHTEAYAANSALATLGAVVISDIVVRPIGKVITIFGGRQIGDDLDEWGEGLIESALKVRFL
jgi:hypothetical protein